MLFAVLVSSDLDLDEELAPAREGDRRSAATDFEGVYAEHFPFVWRNLRRLGVGEHALRDAAQDVFVVVHRRLPEFEGKSTIKTWLFSILRRVAADYRRTRRRKELQDVEEADAVADPRERGPEARAAEGESLRVLLGLLERLDPEKRETLILSDLEAMSVPEIAVALECNVNTIYSRLRAARQIMREAFERYDAARRRLP